MFKWIVVLSLLSSIANATIDGVFPEGAGSNMVFHTLGKYAQDPSPANWPEVKVTLIHYHTYQNEIRTRLKEMRANGQNKIALVLWYIEDGVKCQTMNHVICPQNGKIPVQVERNIHDILQDIAATGFDTAVLRLAAQGGADPLSETYNSTRAQDSWKLFENLYDLAEASVQGTKLRVLYDLGLETMGHPYSMRPGALAFLNLMWNNYARKYPAAKTVGFSFNHAHGDAARKSFEIYSKSGVWPAYVAVDIYENPEKFLKSFAKGLKAVGHRNHPVIIMETFRNDSDMANAFRKYKNKYDLNLRFAMQWPLTRGKGPHADDPTTPVVDAYLDSRTPVSLSVIPTVNANKPVITNAGAGCDDNNCLFVVVRNIERDSYVDIRFVGSADPLSYRGSELTLQPRVGGDHVITLRLRTAEERNQLRSRGLRVWVVNPHARVWNDREYKIKAIGGALTTPIRTVTPWLKTRQQRRLFLM